MSDLLQQSAYGILNEVVAAVADTAEEDDAKVSNLISKHELC